MSTLLQGLEFSIEISDSTERARVSELIEKHGGVLSYMVSPDTNLVITTTEHWISNHDFSYPLESAQSYGVPIVIDEYIIDCDGMDQQLDIDRYLVDKIEMPESSTSSFLNWGDTDSSSSSSGKAKAFDPTSLQQWLVNDPEIPKYPEEHELVRRDLFTQIRKGQTYFFALELHCHVPKDGDANIYRIYIHHGASKDLTKKNDKTTRRVQFPSNLQQAEATYVYHFNDRVNKGYEKTRVINQNVGSLQSIASSLNIQTQETALPQDILDLVNYIYVEAHSQLSSVINVTITSQGLIETPLGILTLQQIEKGASLLLQLYEEFSSPESKRDKGRMISLTQKYFEAIPHHYNPYANSYISEEKVYTMEHDMLQLMRDVQSITENVGGVLFGTNQADARFRALNCDISLLTRDDQDYDDVCDLIWDSVDAANANKDGQQNAEPDFDIVRIYKVKRPFEQSAFRNDLHNKKTLFHGSKLSNWVGLLSHGFLLPKIVTKFGGDRTNSGNLGNGIYFGDDITTSIKYAAPGYKGTRMIAVARVALGDVCQTREFEPYIDRAPSGFNSMMGVKSTKSRSSDFTENEFCIYDPKQQHLQYLIEVRTKQDAVTAEPYVPQAQQGSQQSSGDYARIPDEMDLESPTDDPNAQKAGLFSTDIYGNEVAVPLKQVDVRAQVMDYVAQVVVLQEYVNESNNTVEAKYVFPLDEMSAVCAFEAFINGKHIVAEVKEKQEARKIYQEAVARGDGAYLMEAEKVDVFTVSVGNLPAKSQVVIKITYITEVGMDGDNIALTIPAKVSSVFRQEAMDQVLQTTTDTVGVDAANVLPGGMDIAVSVNMPYRINKLMSPSHTVKIKKTMTMAYIQAVHMDTVLTEDFVLIVGMENPHDPRIWVETDQSGHQAVMLAFYPQFEFELNQDNEFIFLLDQSASMVGDKMEEVKRVLSLLLRNMPKQCVFNIMGFGSTFERLFVNSVPPTPQNVAMALDHCNNLQADLGGTDIWLPLKSLYLTADGDMNPRNVFLISDGQILTNVDNIMELINKNSSSTRLFTFGVGDDMSRNYIRTLARAGGGAHEFITPKQKSLDKIRRQFTRAMQPALKAIDVQWEADSFKKPEQAPRQMGSVFRGERVIVYGFVENCNQAQLVGTFVTRESYGDASWWKDNEFVNFVIPDAMCYVTGDTLHKLTARAMIRDWEDGVYHKDPVYAATIKENKKQSVIEMSLQYNILSQFTSFVAVEKRSPKDDGKLIKMPMSDLVRSIDELDYMSFEETAYPPKLLEELKRQEEERQRLEAEELERQKQEIEMLKKMEEQKQAQEEAMKAAVMEMEKIRAEQEAKIIEEEKRAYEREERAEREMEMAERERERIMSAMEEDRRMIEDEKKSARSKNEEKLKRKLALKKQRKLAKRDVKESKEERSSLKESFQEEGRRNRRKKKGGKVQQKKEEAIANLDMISSTFDDAGWGDSLPTSSRSSTSARSSSSSVSKSRSSFKSEMVAKPRKMPKPASKSSKSRMSKFSGPPPSEMPMPSSSPMPPPMPMSQQMTPLGSLDSSVLGGMPQTQGFLSNSFGSGAGAGPGGFGGGGGGSFSFGAVPQSQEQSVPDGGFGGPVGGRASGRGRGGASFGRRAGNRSSSRRSEIKADFDESVVVTSNEVRAPEKKKKKKKIKNKSKRMATQEEEREMAESKPMAKAFAFFGKKRDVEPEESEDEEEESMGFDDYFFNDEERNGLESSDSDSEDEWIPGSSSQPIPKQRPIDDDTVNSILDLCQSIVDTTNPDHMWSWESNVFDAMSCDIETAKAIVESMGFTRSIKGAQRQTALWQALATSMAVALLRALLDTFSPHKQDDNLFNEKQTRQIGLIHFKLDLAQDSLREFQHQEPNLFSRIAKVITNPTITSFVELGFYILQSACYHATFSKLLNAIDLQNGLTVMPSSMTMCPNCHSSYSRGNPRMKCTHCPLISICNNCHKLNQSDPCINHSIVHAFEQANANDLLREDSIETAKFLNSLV